MNNNAKTIAVFFGGKSPEHDVSIISALVNVIPSLKLLGHTVVPVYIAKNGDWFSAPELTDIKTYQTGKIDEIVAKSPLLKFSVNNGLTFFQRGKINDKPIKIDIAFPVMHGSYGEDGSLMGLLRMANVPFVGCDMDASVIAMNKTLAKIVATNAGVLTPKFLSFRSTEFTDEKSRAAMVKKIDAELKYPLFVKPPHLGSSIGISKVNDKKDLANALEVAAHYDNEILVEEGVENLIEITVPITGENDNPMPSLPERPLKLSDEVFDFESKYLGQGGKNGSAKNGKSGAQGYSEIPAKLPKKLYDECIEIAKKVYSSLGLSGISRVDLLIDSKSKKVYFNEVNPMPGSLYAHNFAAAGISNVDLVKKLLEFAEADFTKRNAAKITFESSFLKQF